MSDELEHAFTHAHSVKWMCDQAAAEIEKMRRYLELPVHDGKENNLPPSYTDMGIGSALARAVRIRTTMSG